MAFFLEYRSREELQRMSQTIDDYIEDTKDTSNSNTNELFETDGSTCQINDSESPTEVLEDRIKSFTFIGSEIILYAPAWNKTYLVFDLTIFYTVPTDLNGVMLTGSMNVRNRSFVRLL